MKEQRRPLSRVKRDADVLESSLGQLPPPETRPVLVILSGLPGSGKSHVARELWQRHAFAVLQIDILRKALFPRPAYTKLEHSRTFAAVHELIERLLSRGISVLYDATNLKELHRRVLYDIADRAGARLTIVRVQSPEDVILRRLHARRHGEEESWASDADEEVYEMMRVEAEPIGRPYIEVDGSGDVRSAVDKIVRELRGE